MKRLTLLISAILMTGSILMQAQVYKFDFSIDKKVKDGYIKVKLCSIMNGAMDMIYYRHGMGRVINLSFSH